MRLIEDPCSKFCCVDFRKGQTGGLDTRMARGSCCFGQELDGEDYKLLGLILEVNQDGIGSFVQAGLFGEIV